MTDDSGSRSGRLILLTIIGIPVIIFLTATWLWYYVASGKLDLVAALGTHNHGRLVQPLRQIDAVVLRDGQTPVRYADLPRKWALVVVNRGRVCAVACEHTLYLTRQIRTALGRDTGRIARLYLSETPAADTALDVPALSDRHAVPDTLGHLLAAEHPDLRALTLAPGGADTLFPEQRDDATTWYVVDPAGWVMMSYNSQITYQEVIADLKFLLKNSGG